jgi:hypothetical protein
MYNFLDNIDFIKEEISDKSFNQSGFVADQMNLNEINACLKYPYAFLILFSK